MKRVLFLSMLVMMALVLFTRCSDSNRVELTSQGIRNASNLPPTVKGVRTDILNVLPNEVTIVKNLGGGAWNEYYLGTMYDLPVLIHGHYESGYTVGNWIVDIDFIPEGAHFEH